MDNPAASIARPILDDQPVGILSVEQARGLLRVAKKFDPAMLPALAIGLFAGLRRSESLFGKRMPQKLVTKWRQIVGLHWNLSLLTTGSLVF